MAINALGTRSLAAINPQLSVSVSALGAANATFVADLASLQTKLASALTPPTILDPASAAISAASFVLGYNPIDILAGVSAQIPALQAEIGMASAKIDATASLVASINALFSAGTASVCTFDGLPSSAGAEIGPQLIADFATSSNIKSLVITTNNDATWNAIKTMFGVN
jgi:hypothetical protein